MILGGSFKISIRFGGFFHYLKHPFVLAPFQKTRKPPYREEHAEVAILSFTKVPGGSTHILPIPPFIIIYRSFT